eukprot:scaffold305_cov247-Pinguiococcus_pyrenoidosus.AAC.8
MAAMFQEAWRVGKEGQSPRPRGADCGRHLTTRRPGKSEARAEARAAMLCIWGVEASGRSCGGEAAGGILGVSGD